MNKNIVLLGVLLRSTSARNCFRYSKDSKKRSQIVGNTVGMSILYLMLIAYCIVTCVGYGHYGMTDAIPVLCAATISILSFFLTFFKTNGYLFNFKEYDMLMSLPFTPKQIAACKFLYMYLKSLPWYLSASAAMMIGYGICAKPSIFVYPIWVTLSLILPVIPMLIGSFIGFLIAKIGSGFRNKNLVMTAMTILIVIASFGLRFFLEDMFREGKTEDVLTSAKASLDAAGAWYPPMKWFGAAVTEFRISDMLLLIGITLLLFEILFLAVGASYRKINSALQSHRSAGKFELSAQKNKSLLNTIAFKEYKRMTGSAVYMSNALIGEIMCVIAGVAVLFVDMESVLKTVLRDAPITLEMLQPAIPLMVYFFIGMVATTAITPSLEGKNYWIVQSLPIKKLTLYQGKMLFNLYLTIPFALFATVMLCIACKASLVTTLLSVVLMICLCAFSTVWGCVCGVRHMRLDWENEVEVIKQGTAIAIYMFPNMFATMILVGLSVFLGTIISPLLVLGVLILVVSALTAVMYRKFVRKLV